MAIFNRKNQSNNKTVNNDVKKYYKSGRRERVGLAWLVAFASLILTIAVVMGLFFGGRWLYRQIANNDEPDQPTSQQANNNDANETAPSNQGQNNTNQSGNTNNNGTSSTSTPAPSQPSPSPSGTPNQPATPPANTGTLNKTGPEHNLAIFAGVSVLGTILHNRYLKRKVSRA
jgi:hypothetical protein